MISLADISTHCAVPMIAAHDFREQMLSGMKT